VIVVSYRDGSRKLFVPDLNRLSRVKGCWDQGGPGMRSRTGRGWSGQAAEKKIWEAQILCVFSPISA
jgi:hypothetical protein